MSGDDSFLNEVNITSKIRAPGEYKYYYCGENNTESDKSFLVVSSMWYTERITEEMELQASCYNSTNTAQVFLNTKTNNYNILIYQNIIDYHNENLSLKLIQQINLSTKLKSESINSKNELDKFIVKVYFVSNNYLLLNEIDHRILLIDIENGNYITIFSRTSEEKESLYNIIDIYDESYMTEGEQRIRTYVFLSKKNQERKTPTYSYKYFIIQRNVFKMKTFFLHSIDFDLGNAEPIGLKIGKIVKQDCNEQKFMYIFIFMSSNVILQLITDYDNVTLHQMLKKHSRVNNYTTKNLDEMNENMNESNEEGGSEEGNNSLENINIVEDDGILKTKHWITKRNVESEKKQFSQSIKIALNINNKRLCAFILFFEAKRIISYTFNYSDSPEEIKDKIFINSNINLRLDDRSFEQTFKKPAKIFKFVDCYLFKSRCFFGYSNNNLIIGDKNKMHIYDETNQYPIYTYEFFNETLSSFFSFEGLGSTFLLTGTKLFKIIFNTRYNIFSNEKIFKNDKIFIHDYKFEKKMGFPIFEYKPEDIWNAYSVCFGIEPITNFTRLELRKMSSKKLLTPSTTMDNTENNILNNDEEEDYEEEYYNFDRRKLRNFKENNLDKNCALCGKASEKCCSDCNLRFYCCNEHFRYDYYSYHFFECQLIQFFNRKDIMMIPDKEIRYKILYNEMIKVAGRILTFIFKRIYSKNDYQYFLRMIICLIQIMDNFGFGFNLSEFCTLNYTSNERKRNKHEKIIFYQEALFFYVQLNLLKCTFALKSGLHNLTDCYLKIIKNDIIPLLTPKMGKRLSSLKCDKPKVELIYNNDYFNEFDSELFFDITKYIKNCSTGNFIDLVEEYAIKHLMVLSLLFKFKQKINSSIEVQNSFVDINLMFDDHYNESGYKNIVSYSYFFTSFYLVEIGKVPQTVKLYKRMVSVFFNTDNDNNRLKALTFYNLGLLQYALGYFDIGIHNIEKAYKLIVENNFSDKIRFKVIDSLGLAYLNRRNLFKAYLLIQSSIQERKKLDKRNNEIICTKLNVYLNYIIDLYEYTFISKARLLIKKKYKNSDRRQLLKFVLGEDDKELVISEQNIDQFIKVVEFVWNLPDNVLKQLNIDNPPKVPTNTRDDHHTDRNLSFNSDVSMTSTFIYKDNGVEKDDFIEEYEEDIEVKTTLYDTLLSRKQQQDFKELKTIYLKRDIILRDSLGDIEKFNINYDPIYAVEFQKIIEKLKSNFLLKEIFYCFQNEKWRDELYNYNQNNILFGLSKYLKLEKIQNMMAIEKTKIMEMRKQEKLKKKLYLSNYENNVKNDTIKNEFNNNINLNTDFIENNGILEEDENEIEIQYSNINTSSLLLDKENEKEKSVLKETNMDYQKFKEKFISALKELEKDKKNEDLYEFLNFDEDYLYNLYINVYKNNPDYKFIFQNPLLILNYIFIEINKTTDEDKKKKLLQQGLNISKINEERNSFQSSRTLKKDEEEKKKDKNDLSDSSSSYGSSKSKSSGSKYNSKSESNINSKVKEKGNSENNNSNDDDNNELNRINTLTKKFLLSQLLYDYNIDEIDETREISMTFICEKKPILRVPSNRSRKNTTRRIIKENEIFNLSKGFIVSLNPDTKKSREKDHRDPHKTFIEEADKYFFISKDFSKPQDFEKTFAIIQKHNRLRNKDNDDSNEYNNLFDKKSSGNICGFSFSPDSKSKSKSRKRTIHKEKEKTETKNKVDSDFGFNYLRNRKIDYLPFINKDKKDENKKSPKKAKNSSRRKNNVSDQKKNLDLYFNLEKEMNKSQNKNKKRGRSTDIKEKEYLNNNKIKNNKKTKKKNINLNLNINLDSFYDEEEKNSFNNFNNFSVPKKRSKNISYRFKTKDEREKELEYNAKRYLQNEYKNKSKNKNNIIFSNNNIDIISPKKKLHNKSTDKKQIESRYKIDKYLEKNKYLNDIKIQNEYQNRNQKRKNKKIKQNSSTTINSSFSENNNNNNYNYNNRLIKNESLYNNSIQKSNNKKSGKNTFQNEFKKIMQFNKKIKSESQENNKLHKNYINYQKNPLQITTENNNYEYNEDSENMCTDCRFSKNKKCVYHRSTRSMPKKYTCNFKACPANDEKKKFNIFYPKKYNVISSTNYTNTDTPKNTTKTTFHGKHVNNNSKLKGYSRELSRINK